MFKYYTVYIIVFVCCKYVPYSIQSFTIYNIYSIETVAMFMFSQIVPRLLALNSVFNQNVLCFHLFEIGLLLGFQ